MKDDVFEQIRIIPVGQIGRFEWEEPAAYEQGVVKHPFLAVVVEENSYLLLEETASFEALKAQGVGHLPLQVCPSDQIRLVSDRLNLTGFDFDDLARLVAQHPDQMSIEPVGTPPPEGSVAAEIEFPNRGPLTLLLRYSTRLGCPVPLEYLFRAILRKGRFLPDIDLVSRAGTPLKVAMPSARLSIPRFSLDDLINAASAERYFPPGVIRASAARRVLNIDFPLSVLTSDRSTAEIESFLHDLVFYREQSCKTAFFEGQLYLLNR